jgi:hypothetical protein
MAILRSKIRKLCWIAADPGRINGAIALLKQGRPQVKGVSATMLARPSSALGSDDPSGSLAEQPFLPFEIEVPGVPN